MVHIHNGIVFSHKNNEILPFVTRMDLESIMLSKINWTKRQMLYNFIYMCNIKQNKTNKIKQNQTHTCGEQTDGCQRWEVVGLTSRGKRVRNTNVQL